MKKVKKTVLYATIASLIATQVPNAISATNTFKPIEDKAILAFANEVKDLSLQEKNEFIKSIKPLAIKYGRKYSIWPSLIIANAIQESNYGTSSVSRSYNNLFNLVTDKDWRGAVSTYSSSDGGRYKAYSKLDDSIEDFCKEIAYKGKYLPIRNAPNVYAALRFYETGFTKDKNKDEQLKLIIEKHNLKNNDVSLYGNYKKKDALKHPKKFLNKQIDVIQNNIEEDMQEKVSNFIKATNMAITTPINTFKAFIIKSTNDLLVAVFNLVTTTIIQTPSELVTNVQLNLLYNKMLIVAVGISAIFMVCGCLSSIINDTENSVFPIIIRGLKNIAIMLLSPIFIPIFVLWSNTIAKGFLSLGINEVGNNLLAESFLKMNNTGFLGVGGFFIIVLVLIVFLFIVFLGSCNRYWQLCKLYVLMPLALSSNIMPCYSNLYNSWKNKFKSILIIQCVYAIHLGVFTVLMSISLSKLIKTMIFIGGIIDLARVPSSIEGLLSYNNSNLSPGRIVQLAANLKRLKGGK